MTRLPLKMAGIVNWFEPFDLKAVMRPKLVELMLVVGLSKLVVFVTLMASTRNSIE
jgi:hypothetical protein